MDHAIHDTADGGALVSAWVTDDAARRPRGARLRAGGDDRRQERDRPHPRRARQDDRDRAGGRARAARERRRPAAPERSRRARCGRSAPTTTRTTSGASCRSRATTSDGPATCTRQQLRLRRARRSSPSTTTPPATASAAATSACSIDPGVFPDYYQYHFFVFRVGNKGDGGALPATIKVARPQRRLRHAGRPRVDRPGPAAAGPGLPVGLRDALQRLARGVQEDARPRGRVPEHRAGLRAAREDARLPAQGPDDAGLQRDGAVRHVRRQQPPGRRRRAERREPGAHGRADLEGLRPSRAATP